MADNAIEVLEREHRDLQELFSRVSSPDEDRPEVLKHLMQAIADHQEMERQLLVPVLKERVEGGDPIAEQLGHEHGRVEHILTLLERRKVNSPDVPDLVTELLDISERHTANADGTVFPALRSSLSEDELDELGQVMASDERRRLTHPHPVLPDSGPVAAVTRKAAEMFDRVRDHSADIGRTTT
ncbi:MAG: hemerythrin domain-containing protein [Acidimicrobiales bacterium]